MAPKKVSAGVYWESEEGVAEVLLNEKLESIGKHSCVM